jgi:putative pyridoxal-dependent aspartate 1-decarboxylase
MNSVLPDDPVSLERYYDWLNEDVLPYTIDTAAPTFIGHMTSALPEYVHDLSRLVSRLNQNLVKIETSKSVTFLERECIAMLHRLFYGLPEDFYQEHIQKLNSNTGIIASGGSTANLSALLSARNRLLYGPADEPAGSKSIYFLLREQGYRDMVVLGTELMHYSFRKTLSVIGLGSENIVRVANDALGRMIPGDLEEKIRSCRKEGMLIVAVIGVAGSTERGSIDPLLQIGSIARQHHIYFHVDAAWGGALAFSEKHRMLLEGIEEADSITFCGHKQLYLPQGISICLFKDPAQLGYNAITANYQAKADSFDTGRFTVEGSRPALSICLHASLCVIGKRGYGLLIDRSIDHAVCFARMIEETGGFELISRQINIINYRYIPLPFRERWRNRELTVEINRQIDALNSEIQNRQFHKGMTFVSKTTIGHAIYGRIVVLRAVLSNPLTTQEHLRQVLKDQFSIVDELIENQVYEP